MQAVTLRDKYIELILLWNVWLCKYFVIESIICLSIYLQHFFPFILGVSKTNWFLAKAQFSVDRKKII